MQALAPEDLSAMAKMQYFEQERSESAVSKAAAHTEFLRTGRIDRTRLLRAPRESRQLTYEEVAERTGKMLTTAGTRTHERLNNFHRTIQFPRMVFHRTLKGSPHLGYCHVTASKSSFAEYKDVKWSFYIANFSAEIASEELAFHKINMRAERMYFAVAMEKDEEQKRLAINTAIRGNGLLFQTHDPKQALKNVLMLGAKHDTMRKAIAAL